jgi:hypothetical protein
MCTKMCRAKCECPPAAPILHDGRCIVEATCPVEPPGPVSPSPQVEETTDEFYVFESDPNDQRLKECVQGEKFNGVAVTSFKDRYSLGWNHHVAVRRLALVNTTREVVHLDIAEAYRKYAGTPYQDFNPDMFAGRYALNIENNFDSIHCSELIAVTYARMGLLDAPNGVASNVLPKGLSSEEADKELPLKGATLLNEIYIRDIETMGSKLFCEDLEGGCRC